MSGDIIMFNRLCQFNDAVTHGTRLYLVRSEVKYCSHISHVWFAHKSCMHARFALF